MSDLSVLKKHAIATLKENTLLYGINIIEEFSGARTNAQKRPVIVVGIEGVELSPAGFGGFLGNNSEYGVNGNFANVTLQFDISIADNDLANDCHSIFESLCDALINSDLSVNKIEASNVKDNKGAFENKLVAKATLIATLENKKSKHEINDFILKRGDYDQSK